MHYYYDKMGNTIRMYTGLSSLLTISGLDNVSTGSTVNFVREGLAGSGMNRYNGFNQLVETELDGMVITYAYLPYGIRTSKTAKDAVMTASQAEHLDLVPIVETENLKSYESPIAKELGEPTRDTYYEGTKPYRMSNSTDWGVVSYAAKSGYFNKLHGVSLFDRPVVVPDVEAMMNFIGRNIHENNKNYDYRIYYTTVTYWHSFKQL